MRKQNLIWLTVLICVSIGRAQSPQLVNYQAIACDNSGAEITLQDIAVKMTFLQGSVNGNPVYLEEHEVQTDEFGLFAIQLGDGGDQSSGSFSSIDWSNGPYFLRVELDLTLNGSFQTLATSQILSVPYAFYSEKSAVADSALNDMDVDPTNELQTIDYQNGQLSISGGNSFMLDLRDDDADPTNELQSIEFNGSDLILRAQDGSESRTSLYVGPFTRPGADISFPQGLLGDWITVVEEDYTVPSGMNFYITNAGREIELPAISDVIYTSPFMPVFEAGSVLRNCECSGLLVEEDPEIDIVLIDFSVSSSYVVPTGKTLFLKSGFDGLENIELTINSTDIRFERPNAVKSLQSLAFEEGTIIELFSTDRGLVYTGYLINN